MHELSICYSLLDQVEGFLQGHPESRVKEIHLEVGALSGVDPQLVVTAWPLASAGTPLEGACLHVTWVPAAISCPDCDVTSQVPSNRLRCPLCQKSGPLVEGEQLILSRLVLVSDE